ncbi:MAG: type IV pilus twitching motility protein PilT [Candidatus Eremiobacteraeota bacterium]|nr:type IV pilus twitching motility protein PilT [Candidatus Eremiobacteraeota bacterium]
MKDPRYEYEQSLNKGTEQGRPAADVRFSPNGAAKLQGQQPGKIQGASLGGDEKGSAISPYLPEMVTMDLISRPTAHRVTLAALFKAMGDNNASDLHLTPGVSPIFRVNGDIFISNLPVISNEDLETILIPLLNEDQYMKFNEAGDIDFAIEVPRFARYRINYYAHHRGIGAVFRMIPLVPRDIEDLNLPPVVKNIVEFKRGLVLVTGPTGSGKTTTLAAMLNYLNRNRNAHIITIEDPLEYVHINNKCLITHRELGVHANSFADALRASIREDPDVILVGEMRDMETMDLALKAAEMGLLVLSTLHTIDAAKSVDRIIDSFPLKQQEQIRLVLSQTLKAVIAQQLVKRKDLEGRYPAVEVLIATKGLSSLIRDGKTHQISSIIQTGADVGMQSLDQAFIDLIRKGIIRKEEVRSKVNDIKLFERAGITF